MSDGRSAWLSITTLLFAASAIAKATELEYEWRPNFGKNLVRLLLEDIATRIKVNANFGAAPQSIADMITFKIPKLLAQEIKNDLMRSHPFAFERVGFVFTRLSRSQDGKSQIILATAYEPVPDEDYIDDPDVGARINSTAIRGVMQTGIDNW